MTKAPFAITAVLGLPLFIGAVILGPAAFDLLFHRRPPERFLIPAGFNGWARIEYRQKGAPPLPSEDGRLLLQLDAHGTLKTSSDPLSGHGRDDFYYYPLNQAPGGATSQRTPLSNVGVCKGGMIWQVETMVDEPTSIPFTRFYVGTEAQYRHEVDPNGKDSAACE
ncbi:MAG TPA: hypothetical protein VKR59_12965 [Terriglobales bacterium]|nr:hypothetical protein [Terriglobales bacterium]